MAVTTPPPVLDEAVPPPAAQRARRPGPAGVGIAAGIAALALAVASVVAAGPSGGAAWLRATVVVAWTVAGFVTLARQPGERLGGLLTWGGVLGGAAALATAFDGSLPQLVVALAVAALPWAGFQLVLRLPDGKCAASRRIIIAGYAVGLGVGVLMWTARSDLPLWPVAVEAAVAVVVGLAVANRRYRKSRGAERQRMQWFGWAVAVGAELVLLAIAGRVLVGWPDHGLAVLAAASLPVPLALALASSPRTLRRVDALLAHTVSLAGLTGVVMSVYFVIVLGLGRVPSDRERGLLGLSMVAAAVAALLYLPARERLRRFANRLVYGEREAPDQALRTFGARLSRAVPMDELLLQVAESLRKSMELSAAEIWTGNEGRFERVVCVPDAPTASLSLNADEEAVVARAGVSGSAWARIWMRALLTGREDAQLRVAPVTHSGKLLGLIVAARAGADEAFGPSDEVVLTELARQVGLALHNVELDSALQASLDQVRHQAQELQASRARIVAASDAARRRIERDLHDGAQQHLVALAVNLRLARQLAEADPSASADLLDQLGHDLQDAVQQLRDLAHGIYPPLLADRGLGEALAAAGARSAIPTDVQARGIRRHSPELEAAVYFCCLEALQNAAKHAGPGARATIRVWEEEGGLLFEVADDGAGFDPGAGLNLGAGFVNMGDRVGAIGGSLSVEAAPGRGATVSGRIPIGAGPN